MKKLWILGFASALLVLSNVEARASVTLDWNTVPQGTLQKQNGVYTTGDFSGVNISVAGTNSAVPFSFGPAGLQTPAVTNTIFSGGTSSSSLSTVALFNKPGGTESPTLTFTINFFGYQQGVKDVNFTLFDVDANEKPGSTLAQDVVTFQTPGLSELKLTGSADNVVSGNKVTGIAPSNNLGAGSADGNVTVKSGGLPLHQIVFTMTTLPANFAALEGISIGNISFTPVPEVGQLVIGLAACLIGAIWLRKYRKVRAGSIA
jgi:hypothetical protein